MLHIPILRSGRSYESIDKVDLRHHATGEPVATMSQANSGMLARDIARMDDRVLERFPMTDLLAMCRRAGELFTTATLPAGDAVHSFEEYIACLSATTGMPVAYCRSNAVKIRHVLCNMETILRGLTRGLDFTVIDEGYGRHDGTLLSFCRVGRIFGAVLPSNSPGVHGLWIPAAALKAPIVLKPGRNEPWTPFRIICALVAAGFPAEAFGFYPTDHAGADELLRRTQRSMLFGDESTTTPWRSSGAVQIHGPGFSKVLLGDDAMENWERYLDVMISSITANAGRSCLNASAIWAPRDGQAIAEALARRLAAVKALPADDPAATLAAFCDCGQARRISAMIDSNLGIDGATDVTEKLRGSTRHVPPHTPLGGGRVSGCGAYLLPTIIWCAERDHPLANREFLFPYASVVECPVQQMPPAIGPTLVVTAITSDRDFLHSLMRSPNVDRLNVGPIPTWTVSWDQPHEGNLFEHLYVRRSFQAALDSDTKAESAVG